jgi:hypothetical protein
LCPAATLALVVNKKDTTFSCTVHHVALWKRCTVAEEI